MRCRLGPILGVAHLVPEYWLGIVRWWHSHIFNRLTDNLDSLVYVAKRRPRGYCSIKSNATIHLPAGNLQTGLTHAK